MIEEFLRSRFFLSGRNDNIKKKNIDNYNLIKIGFGLVAVQMHKRYTAPSTGIGMFVLFLYFSLCLYCLVYVCVNALFDVQKDAKSIVSDIHVVLHCKSVYSNFMNFFIVYMKYILLNFTIVPLTYDTIKIFGFITECKRIKKYS